MVAPPSSQSSSSDSCQEVSPQQVQVYRYPKTIASAIVNVIGKSLEGMNRGFDKEEARLRNEEHGIASRDDLKLGALLGTGGFSDVYELVSLKSNSSNCHSHNKSNNKNEEHDNKDSHQAKQQSVKGYELYNQMRRKFKERDNLLMKNNKAPAYISNNNPNSKRRRNELQEKLQLSENNSQYVVKQLRPKLMSHAKKFAQAAADLDTEAQLLIELKHDNILSIHGWAYGGVDAYRSGHHDAFFLILDRLQGGTLEERIEAWKTETTPYAQQLVTRINVAQQVASALKYLHEKKIVYRDLKPQNIGFLDESYTKVKLFDFGLARHLPKEKSLNDVYEMSGKVGTVRYMAPECAMKLPYNEKVDVYSWAMVVWNCLTLEKPYGGMTYAEHQDFVCLQGDRPSLKNTQQELPMSLQVLLNQSWAGSIAKRLTMSQVCKKLDIIQSDLIQERQESCSETTTMTKSLSETRSGRRNSVASAA